MLHCVKISVDMVYCIVQKRNNNYFHCHSRSNTEWLLFSNFAAMSITM
jgi:hypothetical protein